eukprot:m.164689 g.164689  ORF g.164689 m.164689 type:complete len:484 (-) comp15242_c0_seq14:1339-2790(-)
MYDVFVLFLMTLCLIAGDNHQRQSNELNKEVSLEEGKNSMRSLQTLLADRAKSFELDSIAVVVIGGLGRADYLESQFFSWTSLFKNRIFVTDAPWDSHNITKELKPFLRNVYNGYGSDREAFMDQTHKDHPALLQLTDPDEFERRRHQDKSTRTAAENEAFARLHDFNWHLGQPKYLLGMKQALWDFPDAKWYLIVDSDTVVFPERLVSALHLLRRSPDIPIAFGATYHVKSPSLPHFTSLLGGAGLVISRGGMHKMNISNCISLQTSDLAWNTAPADWRMALCLSKYNIPKVGSQYMYQSNEMLNCLPNGGSIRECAWAGYYSQTMSNCPLTLHYQTSGKINAYFSRMDEEFVCIPSSSWRAITSECSCFPWIEAVTIAKSKERKKQPITKVHVSKKEIVLETINASIIFLTVHNMTTPKTADIRYQVEEVFQVILFPWRKTISHVVDVVLAVAKQYSSKMLKSEAFHSSVVKTLHSEGIQI